MFIESDGNLACPASLSLGQHHNVALLSVPDGDDRPQREPGIFRAADLVLLTKTDLLEQRAAVRRSAVAPELCARSVARRRCSASPIAAGSGIDVFCEWLRAKEAMQSLNVASRAPEPRPLPENPLVRYN